MTASTAPTQPPDKLPPVDGLDIDDWMVLAQHYQGELLKSEAAAIALRAERDAALARVAQLKRPSIVPGWTWEDVMVEQSKEIDTLRARAEKARADAESHRKAYGNRSNAYSALCVKYRQIRAELSQRKGWQKCKTHGKIDANHSWGCPECVREMRAELTAARARLAELQAALLKFGRHDYTCVTTNYDHPEALGVKCDCGLGEMLSDAPAIDYAHEQEFDSWEPGNVERETE